MNTVVTLNQAGRILSSIAIGAFSFSAHADFQNTNNVKDQQIKMEVGVDPGTLALNISVPLADYPGRAGQKTPIVMKYSSKVWRSESVPNTWGGPNPFPTYYMSAVYSEGSLSGWTESVGGPIILDSGLGRYDVRGNPIQDDPNAPPSQYYVVHRLRLVMPNGQRHELIDPRYVVLAPAFGPIPAPPAVYVTLDGSGIKWNAAASELLMPDGSKYLMNSSRAATHYIDRNGNTVAYGASGMTDSAGRLLPLIPTASVSGDLNYNLPKFGGGTRRFVFKWRNLGNVLTTPAPLRDRGSYNPSSPGTVYPGLFGASVPYLGGGAQFNPVVLHEIVFPNQTSYRFTYNVYGEIDKIVYPTGAYETFTYGKVETVDWTEYDFGTSNRGVLTQTLSPSGSGNDLVRTTYIPPTPAQISRQFPTGTYPVTTLEADGTRTDRVIAAGAYHPPGQDFPYGFDYRSNLIGTVIEERKYSRGGVLLRRTLNDYNAANLPVFPYSVEAGQTQLVRQVEIQLDGPAAKARATTFGYAANGLPNDVRTFDYLSVANGASIAIGSIPNGALLKRETTVFDTSSTLLSRNMTQMPLQTTVYDGAGTVVQQSYLRYDTTALAGCGAVVGWSDPSTAIRGNVTKTEVWNSVKGRFIASHASYDACGNKVSETDPLGRTKTVSYADNFSDSVNRSSWVYPTVITAPAPSGSHIMRAKYDWSSGMQVEVTDANNQVSTTLYNDPLHRVTRETRPSGAGSTVYTYGDTPGNLYRSQFISLDATRTIEKTVVLNGVGRAIQEKSTDGNGGYTVVDKDVDAFGRVLRISNPRRVSDSPVWIQNTFDDMGRPLTVTYADGSVRTVSYQTNEVTSTDPSGKTIRTVKDALDRIAQVIEAPGTVGASTQYAYNPLGNLIQVNQGSQVRTFSYDTMQKLVSSSQPEEGTVSYTYEDNGNLRTRTDARGVVTTFAYDVLDRLTDIAYSDGTPAQKFYYDQQSLPSGAPSFARGFSEGRMVAAITLGTGGDGTYMGYDAAGRVITRIQRTDQVNYNMAFQYNFGGNVTHETTPAGRSVSYNYNNAGQPITVAAGSKTLVTGTVYGPSGVSTQTLGNGAVLNYFYNNRLQPYRLQFGRSGAPSQYLEHLIGYGTSNNNGNVQTLQSLGGGEQFLQTFTYDDFNRMKTATETSGSATNWRQLYSYDSYGNRAVQTYLGGSASTHPAWKFLSFNAANNRITNIEFQYDSAGNVIQDEANNYGYDAKNLLTRVNGAQIYRYDAEAKRIRKTLAAENVRYIYNAGGKLVAEVDATSGVITREYIGGHTLDSSGNVSYLLRDSLSSPRVILSEQGAVLSRNDYYPFGEEIRCQGVSRTSAQGYGAGDSKEKFTGKLRDFETNLDYSFARYYSSMQGRFTSVDPSNDSGDPQDPQSWNRYAYGHNNPLKYIDPDGNIPIETLLDIVILIDDLRSFIRSPSWRGLVNIGWSIGGSLLPYVPGSWAGRIASKADAMMDVKRVQKQAENIIKNNELFHYLDNARTQFSKYFKSLPVNDRLLEGLNGFQKGGWNEWTRDLVRDVSLVLQKRYGIRIRYMHIDDMEKIDPFSDDLVSFVDDGMVYLPRGITQSPGDVIESLQRACAKVEACKGDPKKASVKTMEIVNEIMRRLQKPD